MSERLTPMLDALWLLTKDKPGSTSAFCDAILEAFKLDQSRDRFLINAYVYKKMEPELLSYISKHGTIPGSQMQRRDEHG